MEEVILRVRMGSHDAHYAGDLVDGARMLELFGDAATELLIRHDGDEGLFASYENVEFLAPVFVGDYIEVIGKIIKTGNTSRKMEFEAKKVITSDKNAEFDSAAKVIEEPQLVGKAVGICVVPKERQRRL
jgi:3-aminobutyryl-CoA ammonia-lyase